MPEPLRPSPEDCQPQLGWWGHTWRTVLTLALSAFVLVADGDVRWDTGLALDAVLGVAALGLVFFRRRWPMGVAVATTVLSTFSGIASGPATLATVSLATRRRWRQVLVLAALSIPCAQVYAEMHNAQQSDPWWLILGLNCVFGSATVAWGMYIGSRRELLWTLRERASRAEAEQEARASQSGLAERSRIAREMHDVLAHRISQVSMHAGALAYRDDLTAEQMRDSATVIRDSAHQALIDLRAVLGVLRDSTGTQHTPQPTYADLPVLVEAARQAGQRVELVDHLDTDAEVPTGAGRTVFRIIQEGITNAGKHAPGAQLVIDLSGCPEHGIDVELRNPIGFARTTTPGAGLGLIGLLERAELRGGRLEHRRDGESFVLRGWIPWAA